MPDLRQASLEERLAIRTPEHMALAFEVAGIGSRMLAYVFDWLLRFVIGMVLVFGADRLADLTRLLPRGWQAAQGLVLWLAVILLMWLYLPLFEVVWEGQTPGKRLARIRVIKDDGTPMTLLDALLRNVLRMVDFLPGFYGLGITVMFLNRQARRIGDYAAGTIVVKERRYTLDQYLARDQRAGWVDPTPGPAEADSRQTPVLTPAEYELATGFLERRGDFDRATRAALAERLAAPLRDRDDVRAAVPADADGEALLAALAARGATSARGGAAATRTPMGGRLTAPQSLDRFVASRRARWQRLQTRLEDIGESGLKAMSHDQLAGLGQLYRHASADHALAQTYYPGAAVAAYLNRLVATAHNKIYRRAGWTWRTLLDFYFVDVPATFQAYRRYFWLSSGAFFGPAVAAFGLVLVAPRYAELVAPPAILDHISRQEMWTDSLWLHTPGDSGFDRFAESTSVAVMILTNNIGVTAMVFASGALCGIGTAWYLGLNGFMLGALTALTWQHGMARAFWNFVTPHGIIEISMILIGGMGGFILGNCLLAPGRYTRRDAYRLHGRAALRLMLAGVPVLILAGLVEAHFSPMPGPFWLKQAFGLSLGAVLYAYLFSRSPRRDEAWAAHPATRATAGPGP